MIPVCRIHLWDLYWTFIKFILPGLVDLLYFINDSKRVYICQVMPLFKFYIEAGCRELARASVLRTTVECLYIYWKCIYSVTYNYYLALHFSPSAMLAVQEHLRNIYLEFSRE